MATLNFYILACAALALLYGAYAARKVFACSTGTPRMQEIAAAIQEGASAYMNRQYTTVAGVGAVLFIIIGLTLGWVTAAGFLVGAVLSAISGFVGMYVSFQRMKNLVVVPDLLEVPAVKQVIAINRLGQRKPGAPLYLYQATLDELMPLKDVDALVQSYCAQGVKVSYKPGFGEHISMAVTGWPGALQYLSDRLADKPAPSTCQPPLGLPDET